MPVEEAAACIQNTRCKSWMGRRLGMCTTFTLKLIQERKHSQICINWQNKGSLGPNIIFRDTNLNIQWSTNAHIAIPQTTLDTEVFVCLFLSFKILLPPQHLFIYWLFRNFTQCTPSNLLPILPRSTHPYPLPHKKKKEKIHKSNLCCLYIH